MCVAGGYLCSWLGHSQSQDTGSSFFKITIIIMRGSDIFCGLLRMRGSSMRESEDATALRAAAGFDHCLKVQVWIRVS